MKKAVVSFPKSGRTWLRVILHHLELGCAVTHAGSSHRDGKHLSELTTEAVHAFDKIVLLTRDPRDTVVSGFHQLTKRLQLPYDGGISDFIRDPRHGIEKVVVFNAMWLEAAERHPHILPITYEAMHGDTAKVVSDVVAFFDEERSADEIAEAVSAAEFEKLQRKELAGDFAPELSNALGQTIEGEPNSLKVRVGKVGNYRAELSPADIGYCNAVLAARITAGGAK